MCNAFSAIITKDGRVIWQAGKDSHDELLEMAKIKDDTTDGDIIKFAKIEITPDKGYLFPEDKWTLKVDENTTPRWLTKKKKDLCWIEFDKWKEQVYPGINITEARNPVNPLKLGKQIPTTKDIELLKKWDSLWASLRASLGAYATGMVNTTKYFPDVQPLWILWHRGFLPSFDGETWRLHSGEKAEIVWEGKL